MNIPPVWIKHSGNGRTIDGRTISVSAWGWGQDEWTAADVAAQRLQRLLERLSRGDPFPAKYGYGEVRPLREEILQTIADKEGEPAAIVTRNSYGAQVLNSANLLFLDIDYQPPQPGIWQRLLQLVGKGQSTEHGEEGTLARLHAALSQHSSATFRLYRTAAGFRALAVDQLFDPAGQEAQALMLATGTDPAYARLCRAQRSFRARLTPKPWRCGSPNPPGKHPRQTEEQQRSFTVWLRQYERTTGAYATCRYLETVGRGRANGTTAKLVALHDDITRAGERFPLA